MSCIARFTAAEAIPLPIRDMFKSFTDPAMAKPLRRVGLEMKITEYPGLSTGEGEGKGDFCHNSLYFTFSLVIIYCNWAKRQPL